MPATIPLRDSAHLAERLHLGDESDVASPRSVDSSDAPATPPAAIDPPWLTAALAPHRPDWRGPVSVRRHEPDSPESIYLREQAIRNGTWKEKA